jgi:hypothetical protein
MTEPFGPAALAATTFVLSMYRAAMTNIMSVIRLLFTAGIAVANVPGMFSAGTNWSTTVGTEVDAVKSRIEDAMDKAGDGWTADDYEALKDKMDEVGKSLNNVQNMAGTIGGALFAVGAAYVAFWALALSIAVYVVILAIQAAIAKATPAGPAVQLGAETVVNGFATMLDAFAVKLASVASAAGALLLGVIAAGLSGPAFSPVPKTTEKLTQLKIEWAPPNQWVSPVKQDPEPYPSNP